MFKAFSSLWKKSSLPRKQRKYRYNAPAHVQSKFMTAPLSKELRQKHKIRNIRARKGDKVKILRGQFKGKEGRIDKIIMKDIKMYIDKVEVFKKDGSKAFYPIDPSNIVITELVEDKKRLGEKK